MLLIAVAVLGYHFFGDRALRDAGLSSSLAPREDGKLRVVSWNLHNFPSSDLDRDLLRELLLGLEADVLAVQEIKDPEALREVLPEHQLLISKHGGAGHQKLGFFYDPRRIEVVGKPSEHEELTMKGRVRPAFHVLFRRRHGGPDFHAVVVHLKATPDGFELRERQWQRLSTLVGTLRADGEEDVVLLGDFNTTGPVGGNSSQELIALADVLDAQGLRRIDTPSGCSAYWDGQRRDAWQEPSLLDLVFVAGLEESASENITAVAGAHCARHQCEPFRSTDAYPELEYETISDHCPVVIDLQAGVDDDP